MCAKGQYGVSNTQLFIKKKPPFYLRKRWFFGCGGRTRTYDLRVMSPTSFQLLYSAMFSALS